MRIRFALLAVAIGVVVALPAAAQVVDPVDDVVTDSAYVRHDGGTDPGLQECNDPGPQGGSRRQANEPYSVVDPTDPDLVIAGWNDYCLTDLDAGWEGFAFSENAGESWTRSLVPGYPQDTSAEGQASPIHGIRFAGDPIAAFDRDGNLYVGGIAFNRTDDIRGSVWVATYDSEPHASGYPVDYLRTVIVGEGTPSRLFFGIFQDKPMLEVDRTTSPHSGNVYVCWSRFVAFGRNKIYFSRSTDGGETFSRPVALSRVNWVQGCDITVESDGDVYVTWRTFDDLSARDFSGLQFVRSSNGGRTFSDPQTIREIIPYFPFDGSRDCGDGPFECPSGFVFSRAPLEPRVTADPTGELRGVYLAYNAVDPATIEPTVTTYESAGPGQVGQSRMYILRSLDDGVKWDGPFAVDTQATGHQFFPDVDANAGRLALVWQDNRNDPEYSVQLPIGNTAAATSSGVEVVDSFMAVLTGWPAFATPAFATEQVSSRGNQPQYEMFGNRDIPFYGDYNWISLVPRGDGVFAYMTWTDDRNVVVGEDPREETQDGFDVLQCRNEDGVDECPNAGGLDQDIFGNSAELP